MFQRTMTRAAYLVPAAQQLVVTTAAQAREVELQLGERRPAVLVEPAPHGSAAALRYGLALGGPEQPPVVAVFPADHFVLDEVRLLEAVRQAKRAVEAGRVEIVMLAVNARSATGTDLWVELAGARGDSFPPARQLYYRPETSISRGLYEGRALCGTQIVVAKVAALMRLLDEAAPQLGASFARIASASGTSGGGVRTLLREYAALPRASYVEVLARAPRSIAVLCLGDLVWADLGTLERIRDTAATIDRLDELEARLAGGAGRPPPAAR